MRVNFKSFQKPKEEKKRSENREQQHKQQLSGKPVFHKPNRRPDDLTPARLISPLRTR